MNESKLMVHNKPNHHKQMQTKNYCDVLHKPTLYSSWSYGVGPKGSMVAHVVSWSRLAIE